MKRLILLLIISLSASLIFGQNQPEPELSKEYYLQKSKRQKNVAWGLLAGGLCFTVVGAAIASDNIQVCTFGANCQKSNEWDAGSIVGTAGLIAMASSIPMFIIAGNSKSKAASMTYEYRPLDLYPIQVDYSREHAMVFRIAIE